jgi:hypothetical protein
VKIFVAIAALLLGCRGKSPTPSGNGSASERSINVTAGGSAVTTFTVGAGSATLWPLCERSGVTGFSATGAHELTVLADCHDATSSNALAIADDNGFTIRLTQVRDGIAVTLAETTGVNAIELINDDDNTATTTAAPLAIKLVVDGKAAADLDGGALAKITSTDHRRLGVPVAAALKLANIDIKTIVTMRIVGAAIDSYTMTTAQLNGNTGDALGFHLSRRGHWKFQHERNHQRLGAIRDVAQIEITLRH